MDFSFSVIPGPAVRDVIFANIDGCIARVRDAYMLHRDGQTVCPPSSFLRFPAQPSRRIIALPAAFVGSDGVSGIKWIASYPENVERGFPRASATVLLNRLDNGYPYACLEGSVVSAARTAASAALAASAIMENKRAAAVGIVGAGLIARYVLEFLAKSGWKLGSVRVFDLRASEAERFATRAARLLPGTNVRATERLEDVLESELVVFATTSSVPHVTSPTWLRPGVVVLHLSLRDLAPEPVLAANNIVDDVNHVLTAATSLHLTEQQVGHRGFITGTLAELLSGQVSLDRARATIFSPFGLGVLDLAVSRWVYEEATRAGRGIPIPNFFADLER